METETVVVIVDGKEEIRPVASTDYIHFFSGEKRASRRNPELRAGELAVHTVCGKIYIVKGAL